MKRIPIMLLALFVPFVSQALVAPNGALTTSDPSGTVGFEDLDLDYVVRFNNSSSVAIAPHWLLTAAHVADDAGHSSVIVGGTTYNQDGEFYHPTADLALIRLDAPLPGSYDIYTGGYSALRPQVAMVGYGGVGTIPSSTNFTISSSGRGTQRWGTNQIDALVNYTGGFGNANQGFQMLFNTSEPDSTNEAGVGIGDSGGAVFYDDAGAWKLAGIMTDASTGGSLDSILAIDVQQYDSWIISVIPEPAPWLLLSTALGLVLLVQYVRRPRSPSVKIQSV